MLTIATVMSVKYWPETGDTSPALPASFFSAIDEELRPLESPLQKV